MRDQRVSGCQAMCPSTRRGRDYVRNANLLILGVLALAAVSMLVNAAF